MTSILFMPRKLASYRIDERVLAVISTLAERAGLEPQRYLESYFFAKGKELGLIAPDEQLLGETRGGKRPGAGKPKKTEQEHDRESSTDSKEPES
ncbi:hypothetical protein NC981_09255 [Leptolyngbya sp. DQ-M1]|uniref:hypothetical protein n=1 Tax=Leptolyngbya sp. DQ-M1 TaxID=2933920 RepID=UPI003298ED5D